MRFARILVPLDGSRLAEAVMPAACSLAKRVGGTLLLLHVLEHEPPEAVHGEPHLCDAQDAFAYLERQAAELRANGVAVESHVHERRVDDVAPAVDVHAHEFGADLIAMCAHGRSNLRTRLIGSIAERILRAGSVPVLLRTVRRADDVPPFDLRRVLVPIDFGHDVDTALDAARTIAGAYGAAVTLLAAPERPDPTTSRLLPGTSALMRAYDLDALRDRIAAVADRLRPDLPDVDTIVAARPPTPAILEASVALPADLIVLVTDAHGGLASLSEPSTVQQLLRHADLTLLLIREL
jgi:nucleotide-binding universal stress UspA family protein